MTTTAATPRTAPELLDKYEAVIGIECHVELKTTSKMFCGCPNSFGGEPNTKVCPVCLALPGALPVPNARAIEHMLRAGLAFGAEIPEHSKFDRKNYFYPDMPKNYQISQYDMPLTVGGVVHYWLEDGTRRECRLTRIHLEEDTGKSTHASADGRLAGATSSLIDFNRAGVPLMECVGEPDLRSAEEAVAFLETLARTFRELGVSDVKMEEGSLRCDANVSVRERGASEYGTKAEIKNMNSFRSVRRAIESEIARQIAVVEGGGRVIQETRGWDESAGVTHSQRSKEEAHDYRYFPDPDLVPIDVTREDVERVRAALPEIPFARYARYVDEYGLDSKRATQLVDDHALAAWFERAVGAAGEGKALAVVAFVLGDLARLANESGTHVADGKVTPEALAELVDLTSSNAINSKAAKQVLETLWNDGGSAKAIVAAEGLAQVSDRGAIAAIVDETLAANPSVVADYKAGKTNVMGFLTGQVMKASRGKANPTLAQELLREKLGS
ncbi:MAG TPA: Asp-tRNA(Asn)/Glu-tRNA(Gln) amidotransferase subunit GatB [Candidatus Elarobacter sp.]|jgi:aspartyl-tRNA(Asn)/glutamyl-tRNA(Gln) amidotransferase subunit B|nr:Asp-tRNA(Asn)/Glu-tRNA(Gln) amidotransferase subunit GatB [Candidatus Elarobacter sp.]